MIVALAVGMPVCACVREAPVVASSQRSTMNGPTSGPISGPISDHNACDRDQVSPLIGSHFTALAETDLPGALRVLHPMQAITPEYIPARLNARVDSDGVIRALSCG